MIDLARWLSRRFEANPSWLPWVLYAALALAAVLAWSCAREETVDEDGRVRVRWHPPWRWPRRFAARVAASRARYPERARRALSLAWRTLQWVHAVLAWLLALTMLAFVAISVDPGRCPPCLAEGTSGWLVAVAAGTLAAAVYLSRHIARDDPYRRSSPDGGDAAGDPERGPGGGGR